MSQQKEMKIDQMFNLYLNLTSLNLNKNSPQYIETKRAFVGACGMMIKEISAAAENGEMNFVLFIEKITNEVSEFYDGEIIKQFGGLNG